MKSLNILCYMLFVLNIIVVRGIKSGEDECSNRLKSDFKMDCSNCGKCVVQFGKYICKCDKGYQGRRCEIDENICNKRLLNGSFPCEEIKTQCRSAAYGYICENFNGYERQNYCIKFNSACPLDWKCLEMPIGYRCIKQIVPDRSEISRNYHTKQNTHQTGTSCNNHSCKTGFICDNNKCRCPKHLIGLFCQVNVDYCTPNPCKHHAKCESKLGGYLCLCPNSYIGIRCEFYKNKIVKAMANPDFRYAGIQFKNFLTTYEFFVESFGSWPAIEVGYGDGAVEKHTFGRKMEYSKNVGQGFNKKSVQFQHAYNNTGRYKLKVRAWNRFYLVFDRDYEIEVREPNNCMFSIHILNSAQTFSKSTRYLRSDPISITSFADINCPQSSIEYSWSLIRVMPNISVDYLLPKGSCNLNLSYLTIPPFTMDFGKYTVILKAKMVKPIEVLQETVAFFEVLRSPTVAHIDGGSKIKANPDNLFYLDAKLSYDPNYSKKDQSNKVFKWMCFDETTNEAFPTCNNQNKSVLVLPKGSLQPRHSYLVKLVVSKKGDSSEEIDEYGGHAQVTVTVNEKQQPLGFIKCINNCFGNKVNPHRVTAFLGVISLGPKGKGTENYEVVWNVFVAGSKLPLSPKTEFGLYNNHLLILEEQLSETRTELEIQFKAGDIQALITMEVLNDPSAGMCNVIPSFGFGFITYFDIVCAGFGCSENSDSQRSLEFEFVQILNVSDRKHGQMYLGSSFDGTLKKVALAPGFETEDYVATLFVYARNKEGLGVSSEVNVTVFPPLLFIQNTNDLTTIFNVMKSTSLNSDFKFNYSTESPYKLVQRIALFCYTLKDFIESTDYKAGKVDVKTIQKSSIEYLNKTEVLDVNCMMLCVTAVKNVLDLPVATDLEDILVTAVGIVSKLVGYLEKTVKIHKDLIQRGQLDSFGIILSQIASRVLGQVINKTHKDEGVMRKVHKFLLNFMDIYLNYRVARERTTFITGGNVTLLMKNTIPEYLNMPLTLINNSSVKFIFNSAFYNKSKLLKMRMISIDNGDRSSYPFIKVDLRNAMDNTKVNTRYEIGISHQNFWKDGIKIKGSVPVPLFGKIEEKQMQMYRIAITTGQKLLINFDPIVRNLKLRVVIIKGRPPRMNDFYKNGTDIPQKVSFGGRNNGLSLFINEELTANEDLFFYLGILPHVETQKILMHDIRESLLQENTDLQTNVSPAALEHPTKYVDIVNNAEYFNTTLSFAFTVYGISCKTWHPKSKQWQQQCIVLPKTTLKMVYCECPGYDLLYVERNTIRSLIPREYNVFLAIADTDNPLVIYILLLVFLIFAALFAWAIFVDVTHEKPGILVLADNYPTHTYTYLVIVYTGRRAGSGTSSNVGIKLEGVLGTSLSHVLGDLSERVMKRSTHYCFVVKTPKCLGEIYCIHLWIDYTGTQRSWFCDKVVVQDIEKQYIWVFVVKRWFHPLAGNGSMAYTVYQTTNFSTRFKYKESLAKQCDNGMHGWFCMFNRSPYSSYTSKQRVATAYLHITMILLALLFFHGLPVLENHPVHEHPDGNFTWKWIDLGYGVIAALIAFPIHAVFATLFALTAPKQTATDVQIAKFSISSKTTLTDSNISIVAFNTANANVTLMPDDSDRKSVSFTVDQFNQESMGRLRSRTTAEQLKAAAGNDPVVPMRSPTTPQKIKSSKKVADEIANGEFVCGHEVVRANQFCLPPYFIFIAWTHLVIVIIPSFYFTALYGLAYDWAPSLHYTVSLLYALAFSMFVLEMIKLLLVTWYTFMTTKGQYSVEDHSASVKQMNAELAMSKEEIAAATKKVNELRQLRVYSPIGPSRLKKLMKIKRNQNTVANFLIDLLLLVFMTILLGFLLHTIHGTFGPSNYKHIDEMLSGRKHANAIVAADVKDYKDLLGYLRTTLIPLLHYDEKPEDVDEITVTEDGVNYLVGVVQLRQVRIARKHCKTKRIPYWSARCQRIFDDKNYDVGWSHSRPANDKDERTPWVYVSPDQMDISLIDFITGNTSYYPTGGYVTLLGRSKESSLKKLKELEDNKWFDYLTTAVFIDFDLYNPHMHFLTTVNLLAGRMSVGIMYISKNIRCQKVRAADSYYEVISLVMFAMLIVLLAHYIYRKRDRLPVRPHRKEPCSKVDLMFVIVGTAAGIFYVLRLFQLKQYNDTLKRMREEVDLYFSGISFWNLSLTVFLDVFLFFVLFEILRLLCTFSNIRLATFVLRKLSYGVLYYTVMFLIVTAAFAQLAIVLLSQKSFYYRSFWHCFVSIACFIIKAFHENMFYENADTSRILYFCCLVMALYGILRWIIAVIIMRKYAVIKKNHKSPNRRAIRDLENADMGSISILVKDKEFRKAILQKKMEIKHLAMAHLVSGWMNKNKQAGKSQHGSKAMELVALDVVCRRHTGLLKTEDPGSVERRKLLHEEQIKSLSRSVIVINELRNKLEYLDYKIDGYIRWARYENFRGFSRR